MIEAITTIGQLRGALEEVRREAVVTGLVPTMGALHGGHLSLLERARAECDTVIVSIFVNPTQFGSSEDLANYPRDLERDLALAEDNGADFCFVPSVEEMYPHGPTHTVVDPGPLAMLLEGVSRPGHFQGVATVVTKLLSIVLPTRSYFGEKDYQQLRVIDQMVEDLSLGTEVVAVQTVRESDGLALSSRNARLSATERTKAPVLYRALLHGAELLSSGMPIATTEEEMAGVVGDLGGVDLDYAVVRSARTLLEPTADERELRLLIAACIGPVRLIDNLGARR